MAAGNQFRYECRLGDRFRNYRAFRQCRDESDRGSAISNIPSETKSITNVIVVLECGSLGSFSRPMYVGEPVRMLMRWIAIVDVQKRSLSEGEQEARRNAMMNCAPHVLSS